MSPVHGAVNTTVRNLSKQARLKSEHTPPTHAMRNRAATLDFLQTLRVLPAGKHEILYTVGKQLLGESRSPAIDAFLDEYAVPEIEIPPLPPIELDLLGNAYQFLNSKLENLERGSFYTGHEIANDLVGDLVFSDSQTIIDPSCGSGALLFASAAGPHQLVGVDNDPLAVMIAKFNYFLKFPNGPAPRLFHADLFEWVSQNPFERFTYVIGNPPYGATIDLTHSQSTTITTGESFSHFLESGFGLLTADGMLRYLVPEALLNVKRHSDIRDYILDSTNLTMIKSYEAAFTGVMSNIYRIDLDNGSSSEVIFDAGTRSIIPKYLFRELKNHIFSNLEPLDVQIIEKVRNVCAYDLSNSVFGLGVVTGDNKTKLLLKDADGAEAIYTGKDVEKYALRPAQTYLVFDRLNLQQVAPEAIYRAPEKLVYKTISKRLKVAIDRTGSLTTNSANIIIPNVPNNSIESIAALLNSQLYSFLNIKLFGGVNKVARENLEYLPIPHLSDTQIRKLTELVGAYSNDEAKLQDYVHRNIFRLSTLELNHLLGVLGD